MRNTLEVIRFEIIRCVKKPSFWIAALLIPIALAVYIGIAAFSGYSAGESAATGSKTDNLTLAIVDDANFLKLKNKESVSYFDSEGNEQKLRILQDKESAMTELQESRIDILYFIPEDFVKSKQIEIHAKPETPKITDNFSTPISSILNRSVADRVDEIDFAIIADEIEYASTTYNSENKEISMSEQISSIAGPAIALGLFYLILVTLGNRLTVSMTEEKENRISELLLTSISPTNLIIGKVISLMILGLINICVILLPVLIMYFAALNNNLLPEEFAFEINILEIIPFIAFLIVSYFFFTVINVLVGTLTPTAKDASSYSGVVMIMMILPLLLISAFMEEPSTFVHILSYFPPSAPLAILLRGIFGNLQSWELYLSMADVFIAGLLICILATDIFKKNAIEFSSKINLKKLLSNKRTSWKN